MNSKEKGNRGERELLRILQERGIFALRNQQGRTAGALIPKGGKENPDILADVRGIRLHVECKRAERLNLYEAVQQAVNDANGKALPIVAHRKNNAEWLVTFRMSDLLDIVTEK